MQQIIFITTQVFLIPKSKPSEFTENVLSFLQGWWQLWIQYFIKETSTPNKIANKKA